MSFCWSTKSLSSAQNYRSKGIKFRYFHYFLYTITFLLMMSSIMNVMVMNTLVLCMAVEYENETGTETQEDNETVKWPAEISLSSFEEILTLAPVQQSTILSAFAWGSLGFSLPNVILVRKFGIRPLATVTSLLSACATIALPFAFIRHFGTVILLRILQGVGFSSVLPLFSALMADWVPLKDSDLIGRLGLLSFPLAFIFAYPIGAASCQSATGWPFACFALGMFSAVTAALWHFCYRNNPVGHPLVSTEELSAIMKGKSNCKGNWSRKVLLSRQSVTFCTAFLGQIVSGSAVVYYLPTLLTQVLQVEVSTMGWLSILPLAISVLVALGPLVLKSARRPTTADRPNAFNWRDNLLGLILTATSALTFILLTILFKSPSQIVLVISLISLGLTTLAIDTFGCSMVFSRPQVVSSYLLLANIGVGIVLTCLPYGIKPLITGRTVLGWRILFLLVGLILVFSGLIRMVLCGCQSCCRQTGCRLNWWKQIRSVWPSQLPTVPVVNAELPMQKMSWGGDEIRVSIHSELDLLPTIIGSESLWLPKPVPHKPWIQYNM